jgi:hypothetical protein
LRALSFTGLCGEEAGDLSPVGFVKIDTLLSS